MAQQGSPDLTASRRHLELVFRLTNLVLALYEPAWPPEYLSGLQLQSLQLVVPAQHSVPMALSLRDPFVPLLSRRNPSFAALLVQLDHDKSGLP